MAASGLHATAVLDIVEIIKGRTDRCPYLKRNAAAGRTSRLSAALASQGRKAATGADMLKLRGMMSM
jgi:hypothetical protein